jgi:hypothetical protein
LHTLGSVPNDGLEGLAYALSLDAVSRQERALDELRARTGTLLTAAAIVASFLGSRAVERPGYVWLTILGFVAFALAILATSYILLPKEGLTFTLRGSVLLREEEGVSRPEVERRLAYWLDGFYDGNQNTIEKLYNAFRVATGSVLVEAMLWLIKLAL